MKNYKVRPEHIIDLVGKVAASFNAWQSEYRHLPINMRAEYMHFMSDMLDDLIKATYPLGDKSKGSFTGGFSDKSHVGTTQAPKSPCNHKCNHRTKEPIAPKIIADDFEGFLKEFAKILDAPVKKSHTQAPERHTGEFRPRVSDIVTLKDGYKGNYMGSIEGTDEHRMRLENGLVRGFRKEDVLHVQKI